MLTLVVKYLSSLQKLEQLSMFYKSVKWITFRNLESRPGDQEQGLAEYVIKHKNCELDLNPMQSQASGSYVNKF